MYPAFTDNALAALKRRYLSKDRNGVIQEDPDGMFRRVAVNLSQADLLYQRSEDQRFETEQRFFEVMRNLELLPDSPTLMNAGRELQQLSAGFVLPIEDSLDDIFTQLRHTALIHKSGGATGFSFSRIRPAGDIVGSTGGVASGPVSFIGAFDTATDVVKQGGTRRGANMAILHVTHPDIMGFITAKQHHERLSNFNISVAVSEDFMRRVGSGEDYDLINPRTRAVTGQLNARDVFTRMTQLAWQTGDPGIVFLDRINRDNPNPQLGDIESSNPGGEMPMLPYESCHLGSLNLARMTSLCDRDTVIDYDLLSRTIRTAVLMLDNVIDMNSYPLPQIAQMTMATRRIGLGVMGWADLLIQLGIPYDSPQALHLADHLMAFIQNQTHQASRELADLRGPFPQWASSIYNRSDPPVPMRNSAPVAIAPTGSICVIAGVASGIEPLFALCYTRNVMDGAHLLEVNPQFESTARQRGFYSPELMERINSAGSAADLDIPQDVKDLFRVSHDISPEHHVQMQAAFQRHTDNAVSKTINFPNHAAISDIADAWLAAHRLGCKGITAYRHGSKENQVLTPGSQTDPAPSDQSPLTTHPPSPDPPTVIAERPRRPAPRPRVLHGFTQRYSTGHGAAYITINTDPRGSPFELFTAIGKAGGCDAALLEATSRLVTLALRSGVIPDEIISQLSGITCCPVYDHGVMIRSAPDAIARALRIFEAPPETVQLASPPTGQPQCPECGAPAQQAEGCLKCPSCGWTSC